jgi:hypothetical protein
MTGLFKYAFFSLILISTICISCATTVTVETEYPPLIYMEDMETITVIPLEWKNNGGYDYLARDLTRILTVGVKKSKIYTFVDPAILRGMDKEDYGEYVDIYVDCEIMDVTVNDETEETEEEDGNKTKKNITRTVNVTIVYKYISAVDGKIVGRFERTAQSSQNFNNSGKSIVIRLAIALITGSTSSDRMAIKAIQKFSSFMDHEINPYMAQEKRSIRKSTSKNKAFKEAEKLVRQKKYDDAMIAYRSLYEETGSVVAGFNMAILLEEKNQFMEALVLLEEIKERLAKMDRITPSFITKEIKNLGLIIMWNDDSRRLNKEYL